jgi:outer membrane immunogenic protein
MMRKIILSSVMILSVVGVSSAADPVAINTNIISPRPVYDWTGFFAGGLIGIAGGDFRNNVPTAPGPTGNAGGVTVGGQIGYNRQLNANWAVGVEADIATLDIKGSSTAGSFEEDWMATVRARGGYTFSRYFAYATAGVAFTHTKATFTGAGSGSDTVAGFTGGVGLEGKFNDRWSAKLEYLYVNVPKTSISAGGTTVTGGSNNHIGRIGINYHF